MFGDRIRRLAQLPMLTPWAPLRERPPAQLILFVRISVVREAYHRPRCPPPAAHRSGARQFDVKIVGIDISPFLQHPSHPAMPFLATHPERYLAIIIASGLVSPRSGNILVTLSCPFLAAGLNRVRFHGCGLLGMTSSHRSNDFTTSPSPFR